MPAAALRAGRLDRATILGLQRSAGNAAVNRLLQRCDQDARAGSGACACSRDSAAEPVDVNRGAVATASAIVSKGLEQLNRSEPTAVTEQIAGPAMPAPAQLSGDELQARSPEPEFGNQVRTRSPEPEFGNTVRTRALPTRMTPVASRAMLQRDFAIEPPHPDAVGRTLTPAQVESALAFNAQVVSPVGPDGIGNLRDVLGIDSDPPVTDEDFVSAVVQWQAENGLTQDGKLGPSSAGALFKEMGAEGVAHGEVEQGPFYDVHTINPPTVAGNKQAQFNFTARFKHDPANGVYASCCEVRQQIAWDAASAAALTGGRPHAGFPAGHPVNTFIEDRDDRNTRYGHRTGPFSDPATGDEYFDTNGRRNQAFGHRYSGQDNPGGPAGVLTGTWRFRLSVVDVCNGGVEIGGRDFTRVNW
jgi:hypothetical protein